MSLMGRFVDRLLPVGRLTVITPDGRRATYGQGNGGEQTVRFHDRGALVAVLKNPRLGIGEGVAEGHQCFKGFVGSVEFGLDWFVFAAIVRRQTDFVREVNHYTFGGFFADT